MKTFPKNSHEAELLRNLDHELHNGALAVVEDTHSIYRLLTDHFPMDNNSIEWSEIPNSVEQDIFNLPLASETDTPEERAMREALVFFAHIRDRFRLSDPVYFINDGTELVFIGTAAAMHSALPKMFGNNGHLYWLAADGSWCMHNSMTGYINFGFSPGRDDASP
jgi:hypothetical protein